MSTRNRHARFTFRVFCLIAWAATLVIYMDRISKVFHTDVFKQIKLVLHSFVGVTAYFSLSNVSKQLLVSNVDVTYVFVIVVVVFLYFPIPPFFISANVSGCWIELNPSAIKQLPYPLVVPPHGVPFVSQLPLTPFGPRCGVEQKYNSLPLVFGEAPTLSMSLCNGCLRRWTPLVLSDSILHFFGSLPLCRRLRVWTSPHVDNKPESETDPWVWANRTWQPQEIVDGGGGLQMKIPDCGVRGIRRS